MSTTLFGISNCDTIKKAKKWLEANAHSYTFHDYRKQGLDSQWLECAEQQLGWETMLNKRGTTFRQLDAEVKENLDRDSAMALMSEQPAMIKRPILVRGSKMYIGFKDSTYEEIFANE
ncbi:ArsC family reductase [Salinimonas sediminis]|uniref:ArsC family reductase n=1 Tax=Salinimonas sediminis TaxID=2303538 RepID=A0A346NKU9_9ALTE|nr:ArsC family reductase [Salinimonas sediminis]AXR06156.1 ArsC family reductase [Salinimonas sediminis]